MDVMDKIIKVLYNSYKKELNSLNLGNTFDSKNINEMMDIVQLLYFLECGDPTDKELIKTIKHYEYI